MKLLTFEEFLLEAAKFDPSIYLEKQSEPCELFLGRFQPLHNGHVSIIKGMHNPVVAIVKGATTSLDTEKNPLPVQFQIELLEKVFPDLQVIEVPTGYVPQIINILREKGQEVHKIYAGADRIKGYESQISSFNTRVSQHQKIDVTYVETPRVTSATDVRNLFKEYNKTTTKAEEMITLDSIKELLPKQLWSLIPKIAEYIK